MFRSKYVIVKIVLVFANYLAAVSYEQQMVQNISAYLKLDDKITQDLYKLAKTEDDQISQLFQESQVSLFQAFPELKKNIAHATLADLPTPIDRCLNLEKLMGFQSFYIKRDDLSGLKEGNDRLFGSNKLRKLEFLLADAMKNNSKTVITFGCVGSNHALATAVCAKRLGLKSISMLMPQKNSQIVRRNLLLSKANDAKLNMAPTWNLQTISAVYEFLRHKQKFGNFPYVIPVGGSCPLGCLGYINAVYELKNQIAVGLMPEPDCIYAALGSAGTCVGLLIGLKLLGLKSKLVAVAIEPQSERVNSAERISKLFDSTCSFLHDNDQSFPKFELKQDDVEIIYDSCGAGYAIYSPEGEKAKELLYRTENILLDGVYTAKAFAGLLKDVEVKKSQDKVILFWNTFCSDTFEDITSKIDYKKLPKCFHYYFESPVQESTLI